ncbi:MAG: cell division protein ZapA [Alphaproteobacteria bacterium]|nr:cell division protein ZapA [Alphaproteobacteria bacterium]
MSQVEITINGRQYRVACEDGQETHLTTLAGYFDGKMTSLIDEVGQIGDTSLMVMAGLLIADELSDANEELTNIRNAAENDYASKVSALAEQIESLADSLNAG